jgi:hypothetical protein
MSDVVLVNRYCGGSIPSRGTGPVPGVGRAVPESGWQCGTCRGRSRRCGLSKPATLWCSGSVHILRTQDSGSQISSDRHLEQSYSGCVFRPSRFPCRR